MSMTSQKLAHYTLRSWATGTRRPTTMHMARVGASRHSPVLCGRKPGEKATIYSGMEALADTLCKRCLTQAETEESK